MNLLSLDFSLSFLKRTNTIWLQHSYWLEQILVSKPSWDAGRRDKQG